MELTIVVRKTGGIWHATIDGSNEIDERGLTAEIAERKARELANRKYGEDSQPTYVVRRIAPAD